MRKLIILLICIAATFASANVHAVENLNFGFSLHHAQTNSDKAIHPDSERNDYFSSSDWLFRLKQSGENIQTPNPIHNISVRTISGVDKLFQLLCFSKNNDLKFSLIAFRFSKLYSYRQLTGYYIYHLRKILI